MANLYEPPSFVQHFQKLPPDHLYHYTGQIGLLGIVESAELWATKIQYMNDATEFGRALAIARQELETFMNGTEIRAEKAACAKLLHSLSGVDDINIFAVCFCEDGDLLSQWRGYTGGTYGYSIGFHTESLMHIASLRNFSFGKCIYEAEVQRTIVREAITHCVEGEVAIPSRAQWGYHGPLADILFRCGVFFKDPSFEEEREWRLTSSTVNFYDEQLGYRRGTSMITPFYKLPIKPEGSLPIQRVFIGPSPRMQQATSVVTSLLMSNGVQGPQQGRPIAFPSSIPFRNW